MKIKWQNVSDLGFPFEKEKKREKESGHKPIKDVAVGCAWFSQNKCEKGEKGRQGSVKRG